MAGVLPQVLESDLTNPSDRWRQQMDAAATDFCGRCVWAKSLAHLLRKERVQADALRPRIPQDDMHAMMLVGACIDWARKEYPFAFQQTIERAIYVCFLLVLQRPEVVAMAEKILRERYHQKGLE